MKGKILLFNIYRVIYSMLETSVESLGLMSLAAFLEDRGYDASVYQGELFYGREFLKEQVKKNKILAAGFYCDFENQFEVCRMSREIAEDYGIPVILGGPQVTGFNAEYLKKSMSMVCVYGEGEITLLRILECLYNNGGNWKELDGIIYMDEKDSMITNPPGPVVSNLDELPLPAYHRLVNKPHVRKKATILTGRGCPFRCAFCHEGNISRPLRLRSVDRVLKDVEIILNSDDNINYIAFLDDTFTISPERVKDICKGLGRLREKRDFVWYCEGHVKLLSKWPEMLYYMAEAGMVRLQIGIESGVQKVLDLYGKGTTLEDIEHVIKTASDAEIHQVVGFFITGGPFESPETLEINKAFYEKLLEMAPGILEIGPSPLVPYPDTAIGMEPEKYGIHILDPEGITGFADYTVTETDSMKREDIAKGQKELIFHGIKKMTSLFKEGKVPHERIINSFRDFSFAIPSVWYTAVYCEIPFVKAYYNLFFRGAVKRSADIPPEDLYRWRPQRIMEMWSDVDFSEGYPRIGTYVLSPLEFELLLYSTGKLRLKEMLVTIYEKFSQRFEHYEEYEKEAFLLLKKFEDKYWLAYTPL